MKATIDEKTERLASLYGNGAGAAAPTPDQWRHVLERSSGCPETRVNFFKMRKEASYSDPSVGTVSGQEAFDRYAAVSVPTLANVGAPF